MKIIWLGQSGYIFESDNQRLLIDPFLSDIVEQKQGLRRLIEPPVPLSELRPNYVFITHNHMDHFDPIAMPQIHQLYPEAIIAGPESVMEHAKRLGFDETKLKLVSKGETLQLGHFILTGTPAYHSDPYSIGCFLETEGKQIYISGDTLLEENLIDEIKAFGFDDLAFTFIVINGKLGNMNVDEAIEVVKVLQPKLAIPMHYGMFAENTEDPMLFVKGCNDNNINSALLIPGKECQL